MIRFESVTKRYGETIGIEGVSFEVPDRSFYVVTGPTGAGKTTTLNLTSGVLKPEEGDIYFDGERVNDISPRKRDVAFAFQDFILYPNMNVFDNIAFPLRSSLRNVDRDTIQAKVEQVAGALSITSHLKKNPSQLSGGEMQRVGIARALVREPNAFLMDEPLSNLDAKIREELRAELKRLQSEMDQTFLYATPDKTEAFSIAEEILLINDGKIIQHGKPLEVYNDPQTLFVATYLSQPEANLFQGYVSDGRLELTEVESTSSIPEDLLQTLLSSNTQDVIVAVYPEDLAIEMNSSKNKEGGIELNAKVETSRFMGASQVVDISCGELSLKSVSSLDLNLERGSEVRVTFKLDEAYFFDDGDQSRLC